LPACQGRSGRQGAGRPGVAERRGRTWNAPGAAMVQPRVSSLTDRADRAKTGVGDHVLVALPSNGNVVGDGLPLNREVHESRVSSRVVPPPYAGQFIWEVSDPAWQGRGSGNARSTPVRYRRRAQTDDDATTCSILVGRVWTIPTPSAVYERPRVRRLGPRSDSFLPPAGPIRMCGAGIRHVSWTDVMAAVLAGGPAIDAWAPVAIRA